MAGGSVVPRTSDELARAFLDFFRSKGSLEVPSSSLIPNDGEWPAYWAEFVPAERISRLEDNWWGPPGAEGPCGPDTEIYYDWGPELGCGRPECAPGCDCDRYLEVWNLVLMQFYQDRDGTRRPLKQKNIDTGMGLERLSAVQQGVHTVYETDLFLPIMEGIGRIVGKRYGADARDDWALRVIADHGRGLTFLISDGVRPANEAREYVLRRIMRRAIYHGRLLGIERPFLPDVVDLVVGRMKGRYPE